MGKDKHTFKEIEKQKAEMLMKFNDILDTLLNIAQLLCTVIYIVALVLAIFCAINYFSVHTI